MQTIFIRPIWIDKYLLYFWWSAKKKRKNIETSMKFLKKSKFRHLLSSKNFLNLTNYRGFAIRIHKDRLKNSKIKKNNKNTWKFKKKRSIFKVLSLSKKRKLTTLRKDQHTNSVQKERKLEKKYIKMELLIVKLQKSLIVA